MEILSRICEPLKIYSRNKGGTEYKSFSPFTLFADACTADAEDAIAFNNLVSLFIKSDSKESLNEVNDFLSLWAENHADFIKINNNPNTKPLVPLSDNLSKASELFLSVLSNKKVTRTEFKNLKTLLVNLEEPFMDTELAILSSLRNLLTYCKTNYLMQ